MRYPLLIFDWDGTLLDSIDAIVACAQATVAELGLAAAPAERIRAAIGLGLRDTVDRLAPGCDEQTYHDVVATYRRLWWGDYHARSTLFPGVRPLLRDLREAGHVLAVATAKTRDGLAEDLASTGVADSFVASRTVDESESKPDPAMIEELLIETGFTEAEALVVGDSVHDLRMAGRAGADCVAVASGAQPREVLLTERPLACLDRVTDLPQWLERAVGGDGNR